MAKERVTVYMRDEDKKWLANFPASETPGGSAVLIMEWAVTQLRRGAVSAFKKLNDQEKEAIIRYVDSLIIVSDITPAMFSLGIGDWLSFGAGAAFGWEPEDISKLVKLCNEMSPSEAMALLCWAKGYWAKKDNPGMGNYIANLPILK